MNTLLFSIMTKASCCLLVRVLIGVLVIGAMIFFAVCVGIEHGTFYQGYLGQMMGS